MDVLQFFDSLRFGEDVEVVVAALPEVPARAAEQLGGFAFKTRRVEATVPVFGSVMRRWTCSGMRT